MNLEYPEHIEVLIGKFLAGEATGEEIRELELWKEQSPENRDYFQSLQFIYENAQPDSTQDFNTDVAWNRVKESIDRNKSGRIGMLLRIAAMLVIVIGAGYALYNWMKETSQAPVIIASGTEQVSGTLPDSTTVILNRNADIVYRFSNNKREVELRGEAFFDVRDDEEHPFEVRTGSLVIRDIGTSFNVKADEGSDTVLVYVRSGMVLLSGTGGNTLKIPAGNQAGYIKSRNEFIESMLADTNAVAYATKVFVFENATLENIVMKIAEVYNLDIEVAEPVRSCRITTTFRSETAETILDVLAETLQLTVIKQDSKIILEGNSCEEIE